MSIKRECAFLEDVIFKVASMPFRVAYDAQLSVKLWGTRRACTELASIVLVSTVFFVYMTLILAASIANLISSYILISVISLTKSFTGLVLVRTQSSDNFLLNVQMSSCSAWPWSNHGDKRLYDCFSNLLDSFTFMGWHYHHFKAFSDREAYTKLCLAFLR